jgi:alkanesulfonate monooxygenase SsuD/methylene tetrahydromethanopterin reductase-like flavin-dependent oxidoreductase (luciferase family)
MVGGSGEQRTLRLVARYADACNLFGDVDTIRHKLAVLEQHCRDVGRDPAEITKTRLGTLVIADTKEEAEARLEERREAGVDPERLRTYVVGDPDTVSHQVQAYFDAGLDGLIFNMPPGTAPEIVSLGGRTLTERFGSAA